MLTGWKRKETKCYVHAGNKQKIIYMLWHEMKGSRVRVTYLAGGFEWVWDLEWRPRVLDLKEEANIYAWNAGFEGRKETSLMFLSKLESKSSHRGCLSEFEQNNYVWGVIQNRRRLKCVDSSESK